MPDPPVTTSAIQNSDKITSQDALAGSDQIATDAAAKQDTRPSINVLYLNAVADSRVKTYIDRYIQYNYGGYSKSVGYFQIDDITALQSTLDDYSEITNLYIFTHASCDTLQFGSEIFSLKQFNEKLKEIANLPRVSGCLRFEGCHILKPPYPQDLNDDMDLRAEDYARFKDAVFALKSTLKVPKIEGISLYHIVSTLTYNRVPASASDDAIRSSATTEIEKYKSYLPEGADPALVVEDIVQNTLNGATYDVAYEWYRQELDNTELQTITSKAMDPHNPYYARSEQTTITFKTKSDIDAKQSSYYSSGIEMNPEPFFHIIIE